MILLDNKAIKAICNINNKDSFLYNLYIEGKKEGCDAEYTKFSINQIHEYNNTLSKYDIISPYNTKFNLSQRRHMSTCGHFLSNALTSINRCSCKHEHIIFGTNSDIKNFYKHNFDKNVVDFSGDIATSMRQIITSINSKFPNLIKDLKDLEKFAKNINQIEDCNLQNILRNKKIRNQLFKTNLKKDEMEMTKSLLRYILLLGCAGNIIAVPEYAKCSTNQSWGSKGDHIYNKLTTIKETLEKSTTDKKNQKAWQKFIKEYQNQNKSSKGNEYTFEKFIVDNLFIDYYDNKTRKILSKEKEHSGFNKLESTEEWTKWLDINSKLIIERAYRIKLSKEINRSLAFRSMRQCNNVKNLRNIFKYLDFINYNEIV